MLWVLALTGFWVRVLAPTFGPWAKMEGYTKCLLFRLKQKKSQRNWDWLTLRLEALRFLGAAWNSVKEETIRNCFKKTGFEKNNDEVCFFPTVFKIDFLATGCGKWYRHGGIDSRMAKFGYPRRNWMWRFKIRIFDILVFVLFLNIVVKLKMSCWLCNFSLTFTYFESEFSPTI